MMRLMVVFERLLLTIVVVLLVGWVVAVGAGAAPGRAASEATVTLSAAEMNPASGETVLVTASVHIGDLWDWDFARIVGGLAANGQGDVGIMVGNGYSGEDCEIGSGLEPITQCTWLPSAGNYEFTFEVHVGTDPTYEWADVYVEVYGHSRSHSRLAVDSLRLEKSDLGTTGALSGAVSSALTGEPVNGVFVRAFAVGVGTQHESWSDETGVFEISGLAPGDYVVHVTPPDFDPHSSEWLWRARSESEASLIPVEAGKVTGGLNVYLLRQYFTDDDGSVFEEDIEWMAAESITKGCNPPLNDWYCPDSVVTRGQMAAFLTRALDLTDRLDNPFTDDDGHIFEADIERLAAAGITKGCNPPANDQFCPDHKVTREQMAAFLVRAMGYTNDGGGDLFSDDDLSIFEGDIDRLAAAGVTKGCNPPTNDRFCPTKYVTRDEMAAFLHRALG